MTFMSISVTVVNIVRMMIIVMDIKGGRKNDTYTA